MDLDADRQVLLSLPVKYTLCDAELFLLICFYKLLIKQRPEKRRCELTFSVGVFFGIHLLVVLLAFQMFLSTEVMLSREEGRCFQQSEGAVSHSPFPAAESPPSPSSGPVDPSPASCETKKKKKNENGWNASDEKEPVCILSQSLRRLLTGSVRSSLSSSNTV